MSNSMSNVTPDNAERSHNAAGITQSDAKQGKSAAAVSLGGGGVAVMGIDLLICLANLFALGWMIYKLYFEQHIDYVFYSFFVYIGMAATSIVGIFGTLGNVLLLRRSRSGARFAWYRIALGIASVGIALVLMFMVLPRPDNWLSETNQGVYIGFISSSIVYTAWLILYTVTLVRAGK